MRLSGINVPFDGRILDGNGQVIAKIFQISDFLDVGTAYRSIIGRNIQSGCKCRGINSVT